MRTILAIIFIIFATPASANYHSFFQGKIKPNPTYAECRKAIEKGVLVGVRDKGYHVFFYKDHLYVISGGVGGLTCTASQLND